MEFRSREELLNKIVCVFSEQPEVREITLFGSNADATEDNYSDIDIRVHSNDLLCTQKKYLQLINSISPIFEKLIIQSDSENFAQMTMLRDYSPYHKIDFGICSGACVFTPSRLVNKK
ncbi:MAG: aminoglycoside 6-adenylyltransferase [Anaerolineaceae bacterium]